MFAQLRGILADRDETTVTIDVGGVGFAVGMSTLSLAALGPLGSEITVFTELIVRDDALDLYGFLDQNERNLFQRLLSVSGVGPKLALSALSSFDAATLQQLIITEDVKRLTTVSGLGKKTAQRLILELKGTLVATTEPNHTTGSEANAESRQVTSALLGMGFSPAEIELAVQGYSGSSDVAAQLRYALQRLGGSR